MNAKTELPPVNGQFVEAGFFLALPPHFPGLTQPPEREHCRLQRLCLSPSGRFIYAAAAGPDPHLFQFAPRSGRGYAVDLGAQAGASGITGLLARPLLQQEAKWHGEDELLLALRNETGTRLVVQPAAIMTDGIQEWTVRTEPPWLGQDLPGFLACDLQWTGNGSQFALLGAETCRLFEWREDQFEELAAVPVGPHGGCLLATVDQGLWLPRPASGEFVQIAADGASEPQAVACSETARLWRPTVDGCLYADAEGRLYQWTAGQSRAKFCGQTNLSPVHAMAQLPDRRIYASAGADIAHWYLCEENAHWAKDLGVTVSTLTARRYGLQFSDLKVGSGGEIYAAENDHGGHLWIYFPPQGKH